MAETRPPEAKQPSGKYKKRFGDRKDARWLRDIDPMHKLFPYVMPGRCQAEVYFTEKFDVTELLKFIDKKKEDPEKQKITFFHAVLTAVAKTVKFRPALNRYIVNKRVYERHDITLSFVAKKEMSDRGEESLMVIKANDDDNIDSISKKTVRDVDEVRKNSGNTMDDMIAFFTKFPRWLFKFFFFILRRLENHGLIPSAFTEGDSNYTTVLLANLGSIKCNAIYHHLNEWGTNSIMITIGRIHKEPVMDNSGNVQVRDFCELGITLDERIADGFYFARSVDLLKYFIEHPDTLDIPISQPADMSE